MAETSPSLSKTSDKTSDILSFLWQTTHLTRLDRRLMAVWEILGLLNEDRSDEGNAVSEESPERLTEAMQ